MQICENDDKLDTYSYQDTQVIIITVFTSSSGDIAIIEDINTGEQFEVFKDQLY